MNDQSTSNEPATNYKSVERSEILARFFSLAFPEPEYTQTPMAFEYPRDDHGIEIFRDGKKEHTVYISSAVLADRHPTSEKLKELLETRRIAKQITEAKAFRIDHAALGTDEPMR